MSKSLKLLLFLGAIMAWLHPFAQNTCNDATLAAARQKYHAGDFEIVPALLLPCLNGDCDAETLTTAFELMTLNCLAKDSLEAARKWGILLIDKNPSYAATTSESLQFARLIEEIRADYRRNLVTAVSKTQEKKHEAPATVIIISEEEIVQRGYISLEEVFSDLPGFDVSRTYGATLSNIYMRGYRSGSTRGFLLMIDGVEANDLWTNTAMLSQQYPISNIKSIEVVYGPGSSTYGPNVLQGVVNVVTKKPEDLTYYSFPGISYSMSNGTYKTLFADLTMAGTKKNIGFTATFKRHTSDERVLSDFPAYDFDTSYYNSVDYARLLGITSNAAEWVRINNPGTDNPYLQIVKSPQGDTLAVNLTPKGVETARYHDKIAMLQGVNQHSPRYTNRYDHWFFNAKLYVSDFTLGIEFWKYEQGVLNTYTDLFYASAQNLNMWVQQQASMYANFNKRISNKLVFNSLNSYRISGTANDTRLIYVDNYSNGGLNTSNLMRNNTPQWNMLSLYQMSEQFRSEVTMHFQPSARMKLLSGLDLKRSSLPSNYRILLNPSSGQNVIDNGYYTGNPGQGSSVLEITEFGVFAQLTYKWNEWLTSMAGGRFDYHNIKIDKGHGAIFNPKLAIVANYGQFTGKAMFATANQNYINDLEYFRFGQRLAQHPGTEPQRSQNLEISAGYRLNKKGLGDVAFYHYTLKDFNTENQDINDQSLLPTGQPYSRKQKVSGLQSNFYYQWNRYTLNANYTWCLPKEYTIIQGKTSDNWQRVGDIASHRLNLAFNMQVLKKFDLNLRANYTGSRKTGPGTTVPDNLEDFPAVTIYHTTITYNNLQPGLNVQLIVNNVLDKEYSHPGIYTADGEYFSSYIPQYLRIIRLRATYNLKNSFR
ncbi:MAG: TonB-dependent receptor [Bacteroidales bacterium]|nr:TonB-dependent receptor [Bacteroidales bacterium]MDZ4205231.1 TonB-dependent receptor [Bacteroidales bacterium]